MRRMHFCTVHCIKKLDKFSLKKYKLHNVNFVQKTDTEKLCFILSNHADDYITRQSAKFYSDI